MADQAVLQAVTEVAGRQTDLLFAIVNLYALVVIAVVGWIVQTVKDGAGISWTRILLFDLGLIFFFVAIFLGLWWQLDQLRSVVAIWADLAEEAGLSQAAAGRIATLPPQDYLWGLWGFNAVMLILVTVLLRQGGTGRKATPIVS